MQEGGDEKTKEGGLTSNLDVSLIFFFSIIQ